MAILVTGATGYIGSHFCAQINQIKEQVVLVDNFSNSSPVVLNALKLVTGREFIFHELDLCDYSSLEKVFNTYNFDAVVHFAGLKSVAESEKKPLYYYQNNVVGSLNLLRLMQAYGVKKLIFSSSATVYGAPITNPYKENHPKYPINVYGRTKLLVEEMIESVCKVDTQFSAASLRYFNPVGAHKSGIIGEDPNGIPNNLMPYITQVAINKLGKLKVFGNDYNTKDGTGVRDYIHVLDLVDGHICAFKYLYKNKGFYAFNLGTGKGTSVLDLIHSFEKENNIPIPFEYVARRAGDLAEYWADAGFANDELGWSAKFDINDMVRDSWNWQMKNPNGFQT